MAATAHSVRTEETCFLYEAAGRAVPCQPEHCSLGVPGSSGCILERLGFRPQVEQQPELRRRLLALRSELSAERLELPDEPLPPYTILPLPGFRR